MAVKKALKFGEDAPPFKKGDIVECLPCFDGAEKNGGSGYWPGRIFKIGEISNAVTPIVLWPDEKYDRALYKLEELSEQRRFDLRNGVYGYAVTPIDEAISVVIDKINIELNSL